ncbi:hypothetical protein GH714_002864 [Hevea brasiliensis]|uniref:Protein FAM91A1 n=2 Tax=Magnoliopsida TaxID=3398 RepID=A0A6A6LI92_HEVBR|nr:hypothetical protein GH714_002864 [Hevea brasiliensis]
MIIASVKLHAILILWLTPALAVAASLANPTCQDTCGGVVITFPFGIGKGCYMSESFEVTCNYSFTPPKPFLASINMELLAVLTTSQVQINNPVISSNCSDKTSNIRGVSLSDSPFVFSDASNRFTAMGCDNYAMLLQGLGNTVGGCLSICLSGSNTTTSGCYGLNCCQSEIPPYVQSFEANMTNPFGDTEDRGGCKSAFMVDQDWFKSQSSTSKSLDDLKQMDRVPAVLNWAVDQGYCDISKASNISCTPDDMSRCTNPSNYFDCRLHCMYGPRGYIYSCKCPPGHSQSYGRCYPDDFFEGKSRAKKIITIGIIKAFIELVVAGLSGFTRIVEHCIKKRQPWNTCFARKVCKEGEYYEDMMRYLRKNLALFPYHLAEYVCRVMRISAFRYYCDMIFEVMKNEQPYDSIPNFSAADALRLTGIGRNEFIDIMNKCRSKKIMWKLNKSIAKELLPTQPVDFAIEPWWGVCLVNFTLEEFKKLSEEETATIDKVCKEEANEYILFDPDIVKGLYRRGLIYFDVPVYPDDRFKVSRLEGFVSNRDQSYEDPIEELLYAVFVVSSENATVAELATTLQADLSQLQAAASFACRLGWAVKLIDPGAILQDTSIPGSPKIALSDEEDAACASISAANVFADGDVAQQGDISGIEYYGLQSSHARVAFIVDANITSYLMMGSVSPGLKSHAVTLYEAGKLGHASIADLCKDLSTLEGAKFEGELQEFANHAFSLRCVLECLLSGGIASNEKVEVVCNKMGTLASSDEEATTLIADVSLTDKLGHSGANETDAEIDHSVNSGMPQDDSHMAEYVTGSTADETSTVLSEDHNSISEISKSDLNVQNDVKVEESVVGRGTLRRKRKYRVDILRCESLAALAPETLDRLFLRDYDIVVSIIPLPPSSVLPGPKGPIHFGPPCHSSLTPWMKLVLYSSVGSGPLSVVLMKGQCLRLLPAPLAGCEKALIWSWDGSIIGGLGGKFEGNLVKGGVLLHCLNSLLKYSAVLVQPLSRYDLDESGRVITMDIPLPLNDSDGSIAHIENELVLSEDERLKLNSLLTHLTNKMGLSTIGYVHMLKLFNERVRPLCT